MNKYSNEELQRMAKAVLESAGTLKELMFMSMMAQRTGLSTAFIYHKLDLYSKGVFHG